MDVLASLAAPGDPYPFLAKLRENEPVHHAERADMWFVSRHAEMQQAFRALGTSLRRPTPDDLPQMLRQRATTMLADSVAMKNPPEHTRLRRLVARDFTTGRAEGLRAHMTSLCGRLLDDIEEPMRDGAVVDLCATVLDRFPLHVISSMLGIPDGEWLAPHIKTVLAALSPTATPEVLAEADEHARELETHFTALIAYRRRSPSDDLISALVSAEDGLTEQEILGTVWAMWLAGFETSASATGLGVLTMLDHPGEIDAGYVSEVLRYNSPIVFAPLPRIATRPLRLGDTEVPEGAKVHFVLAAANRDPAAFDHPDRFDPRRQGSAHTTFGGGINRCLGAALASAEMSVMLSALRSRFPTLVLANDPVFAPTVYLRAPERIQVTLF